LPCQGRLSWILTGHVALAHWGKAGARMLRAQTG
jgi:hypothetical protein